MANPDTPIGWLTEAELVMHRLRSFHQERVGLIRDDKSHVRLSDPSRLIVHLLPEAVVRAPKFVPAADLKRAAQSIRLLGERNGYGYRQNRYNADGLLLYDGREAVRGYSQLHRNGIYEGVMAEAAFQHPKEQAKVFREDSCEEAIISALAGYLPFAKVLALEPPFWMLVALVGCEGARICTDRTFRDLSEHGIDRNLVWLPETKIDGFDIDPVNRLRPVCDVLWNAVGMERSFSYDEQGNRKPRQQ